MLFRSHPAGFPNNVPGQASWEVGIDHPDFTITKQCVSGEIPLGGTAIFTITVTNTGDVDLTNVIVKDPSASGGKLSGSAITFPYLIPLLPVGASAVFEDVAIVATVANVVNGQLRNDTSAETTFRGRLITRSAGTSCPVRPTGATRTPGFWQTQIGRAHV